MRHIRGLSSRLYQVREGTGEVVVLTSKIAGNEDSAGKNSPNHGNEMLSTDETEVR